MVKGHTRKLLTPGEIIEYPVNRRSHRIRISGRDQHRGATVLDIVFKAPRLRGDNDRSGVDRITKADLAVADASIMHRKNEHGRLADQLAYVLVRDVRQDSRAPIFVETLDQGPVVLCADDQQRPGSRT